MSDLTLSDVVGLLEGYSGDEVAQLLLLADKKGVRNNELACPVANYLKDVLGEQCSVDNYTVYLRAGGRMIELPDGVQRFITEFDEGEYPELDNEDEV